MAWQNEMTLIIRHLINDLDSSAYTFTDSRIQETVLVSAQLVLTEIDFTNTYTVDVDALTLSPDPTTGTKDNSFIALVALKSACIITGSQLRTQSLSSLALKDGPSSIDTRGIVAGLAIIYKDVCEKYETAKMEYKTTNSIGQAILGPYSPGSAVVGGRYGYGDSRTGYFQ
jgi:hypothetical protein